MRTALLEAQLIMGEKKNDKRKYINQTTRNAFKLDGRTIQ